MEVFTLIQVNTWPFGSKGKYRKKGLHTLIDWCVLPHYLVWNQWTLNRVSPIHISS